ncbi:hypothetical protein B5P43_18350 [Bacillus sp. SRB_336]|nr:hypothetical protein B5P43_18350 [Bacillus sp. SRB_336]
MKVNISCKQCSKEFRCGENQSRVRKFCSLACRNDSYVGGRCNRPVKYRDDYAVITTAKGVEVLISVEDVDIAVYSWADDSSRRHGAPHARVKRQTKTIHRFIYERMMGLPVPRGTYIDHINRNQLDNRRKNLRPATPRQNVTNSPAKPRGTSPYKGVYRLRGERNWIASMVYKGKRLWLGTFEEERDAAYIYDQFALALDGEYACFNVLNE